MKLRPLGDRILVQAIEEQEVKKGGIIIPDTAKEKPQEGKVVAVGPGKLDDKGARIAMNVKEGDKVVYGKYAGNEIKINDEDMMIMHEDDIYGVIED